MKLTKKQALEETVKKWKKLGSLHSDLIKKSGNFGQLIKTYTKSDNFLYTCALCEYTVINRTQEILNCNKCPLLNFWFKDNQEIIKRFKKNKSGGSRGCFASHYGGEGSDFEIASWECNNIKWVYRRHEEKTIKKFRKLANNIAKAAQKELDKMKG